MLPGFICLSAWDKNLVFPEGKCKWGFLSKAESMGMLLKWNYFRIKKNPCDCMKPHTWASAFRWDLYFRLSNVDPVRMSTEAAPCWNSWGGVAGPVAQEDKNEESENS